MPSPSLKVTRVSKALGAEVRGFEFADVDAELAGEIQRLLWEHQVLFFPDQQPSPATPLGADRRQER